jgi:hypothetical protein
MRSTILFLFCFVLTLNSFAQAPQKFNYQAVVRNNSGVIVTNQNIAVKDEILDSNINTVLYSEIHAVTTNPQGLFSLQVGGGTVKSGVFANIDWSAGNRYIRTSVDLTGGTNFQLMGTSQLLSVPYALYAKDVNLNVSLIGDTVQIGNKKIIIPGTSIANTVIDTLYPKEGLIAYYPFSGNANDESGNGNNGTVYGATLTSDRFGNENKAFSFNGAAYGSNSNSYILVSNSSSLQVGSALSISIWVKYNLLQNNLNTVLQKGAGGGCQNVGYYVAFDNNNGSIPFNKSLGYGQNSCASIGDTSNLDNKWHNISFVYAPPSGNAIYLDGKKVGNWMVCNSCTILNSNNPLIIGGCQYSSGGYSWNGLLDDIRIYNRALSQDEITYLASH